MNGQAGKGDARRPRQISIEEERLRWKYACGGMTFAQFEKRYKQLVKEGKITRSGRKIGETYI